MRGSGEGMRRGSEISTGSCLQKVYELLLKGAGPPFKRGLGSFGKHPGILSQAASPLLELVHGGSIMELLGGYRAAAKRWLKLGGGPKVDPRGSTFHEEPAGADAGCQRLGQGKGETIAPRGRRYRTRGPWGGWRHRSHGRWKSWPYRCSRCCPAWCRDDNQPWLDSQRLGPCRQDLR